MGENNKMRKVFIIAPHFPPSALPPSQRARLLVKHFKTLGYFPTVFTTPQKYREDVTDPWMTELTGDDFDLINIKALPYQTTRKFKIGDLGLRWLPFLYKRLKKEIKNQKPDFILYLVPPWYLLTIAPKIKRKTKVPYAIDFIDPWVDDGLGSSETFKQKISQKVALHFERKAVENADVIIAVSEGINNNLKKRYHIKTQLFGAIPYGVEISDFENVQADSFNEIFTIRYIGAVWSDAYPVLDAFLNAFSKINNPYQLEFYGTSYAAKELAKPQLTEFINKYHLENKVIEDPLRVPYKKAVELTVASDLLILFGGMQPYYAASKLFGLIASKKPFIAFLHEDSFPSIFLAKLNYPYLVTYSQSNLPVNCIKNLEKLIDDIMNNKQPFVPLNLDNPAILKNTAYGMTKEFVSLFNQFHNNQ